MVGTQVQRWAIAGLSFAAVLYCLIVLWYVPTQPCIPVGCLLSNVNPRTDAGVEIRDVGMLKTLNPKLHRVYGVTPEVGDIVIGAAGRPMRSFGDWARLHRDLRSWKIDSPARIPTGKDPTEDSALSNLAVFEYPDHTRTVVLWLLRPGSSVPVQTCLPLVAQPTLSISGTLLWFVLELCVLILGGVAHWNRPFDQPLRIFCVLSALTLAAFVGGSHWWLIAGSVYLTLGFALAGTLLPATLLHFFLVYPFPVPWFAPGKWRNIALLYLVPGVTALVLAGLIVSAGLMTGDWGPGPFAQTLDRIRGEFAIDIILKLRLVVFVCFAIGVSYYLLSLLALRRSLRVARNPFERNQVRSLLWAAFAASLLIGYTVYLVFADQVRFALGAARLPMFGASLAFMLAYAIGIARYKLLLIDQVVSRGAWYYCVSGGLSLIFASLLSIGAVQVLHQDLSIFGQTVPLILVLMTAVLILSWGRDAVQRILDRRFYSEKYQLDKAFSGMNRVASNVLEPQAVVEGILTSCLDVLHITHASLFLRKGSRMEFRMFTACGKGDLPVQVSVDDEILDTLTQDLIVQRVLHNNSNTQRVLRQLQAEAMCGLEVRGYVEGLMVLGTKPNFQHFSAEDLAFIGAMARIAGVAMYCATVQEDATRLNQDLQLKMGKIEDQNRQLTALQNELAMLTRLPAPATVEMEFQRDSIRGNSPAILGVLETVKKVSKSNASVLIRGESGTGKELLARSLHENSPRRNGPLVSVHCAALASNLLESELFGHVKGAFTDARQDKLGRFQLADGGTLFLDEIGDISLDVQVKLLRVLQERVFEPVGSSQTVAVDVRIVAATHRNLEKLIETGQFREDLYYRLNVISVTLPPLRERQEDLYELALHFLRRSSAKGGRSVLHIDDEAMKAIHDYHWPGNIREMENVIERAVVLADGTSIRAQDLPAEILHAIPWPQQVIAEKSLASQMPAYSVQGASLKQQGRSSQAEERRTLVTALASCEGNKAEAARLLGIPRSTFFSKLKKHGIS